MKIIKPSKKKMNENNKRVNYTNGPVVSKKVLLGLHRPGWNLQGPEF